MADFFSISKSKLVKGRGLITCINIRIYTEIPQLDLEKNLKTYKIHSITGEQPWEKSLQTVNRFFSLGIKRENSRKTEIYNCNSPYNNHLMLFKRFINGGSNNPKGKPV